ncbi:MAG: glycosyltransferase [Lachnospiraceae bacterium]
MIPPITVHILLSTYNGEAYLAEQLDSLLAQTYPFIKIYIRDDGSSDNTLSIIANYTNKYNHIVFLKDSLGNIGYEQSFWTLLRTCEPAAFYAFCDQDDIWYPNKVERGVYALQKKEETRPLLYTSSYAYYNETLEFTGNAPKLNTPIQFKDVLFYTPAFGFTILLNETLRTKALSVCSLEGIPHDGLCQKIAAEFGEIVYDSCVTAKYRRHTSTVTYANSNKLQLILKWIRHDILGSGISDYRFFCTHFYKEFKEDLTKKDQALLKHIISSKNSWSSYFKLLFFPHTFRPTLGGELALRLSLLLRR